jgi:6,7-dimethyl-8-ribityllumazine synthase
VSGAGSPQQLDLTGADRLRVAVVCACWHPTVSQGLLDGALRALADLGIAEPTVVRVPGAFELPVVAAVLTRGHDAVVALGVVIRGGTPHFEYVCQAATDGLSRVALDTGVPIGFGLLTCDDERQAFARAGFRDSREDKGREAAEAAIATALAIRRLGSASTGC